jgi:beta-galactosidase beta subunit
MVSKFKEFRTKIPSMEQINYKITEDSNEKKCLLLNFGRFLFCFVVDVVRFRFKNNDYIH